MKSQIEYWIQAVLITCAEMERYSLHMQHARDVYGMANNTASRVIGRGSVQFCMADGSFDASGGILRVSKGNKEMLWGKKTEGLYRLEESVQTGGATVRHGFSGISEKNGQGKQPLHRVAVISPIVHTREERWSHNNSQSDVLCDTPRWGVWGTPVGGAGHLGEKMQTPRCGGAYTSVGSGVAR
ncbi:hypothetical protein Acr_29g0009800 [Actinidia rufa]|uniref:Uncharacterized protein n=1 Tax=Actinidia rufa TaxID=165716 RepID=A0A7J0HFJ4_9ERIC|nr:hypothetical protein Acr_29g0009800 [Actinidia rufa]